MLCSPPPYSDEMTTDGKENTRATLGMWNQETEPCCELQSSPVVCRVFRRTTNTGGLLSTEGWMGWLGLPAWGVTHSCGISWPDQKTSTHTTIFLTSCFHTFLHSLNLWCPQTLWWESPPVLDYWLDKCHMLPGKQLSLSPLTPTCTESTIKCYLMPARGLWFHSVPEKRQSASAAAADLSITCPMCKLQLGWITRYYKYQAIWQESSGTPAFAHYRCYILSKHRWLE